MKHVGDIKKLSGYTLPAVDCITGGSPCQDLSVAGQRKGLAGERSGLFMEQIRLIKELRDAERKRGRTGQFIRPRYMVWENVPGAFSSNGGKDFKAVLEETIRIAEPDAPDVPLPESGKWSMADAYYGDGWSIAYRVFDAQFWGVPQRRRRIALVADFGGLSAAEILFERKGLSGDFEPGEAAGKEVAGAVRDGTYPAVARAITRRYDGSPCADRGPNIVIQGALNPWDSQSARVYSAARSIGYQEEVSPTLRGGEGGNQKPCVYDARGNGDGQTVCTLTGDHQDRVTDYTALVYSEQSHGEYKQSDQVSTMSARQYKSATDLIAAVDCRNGTENPNVNGTLQAKEQGFNYNSNNVCRQGAIVRRLTPLECERLQGYPDHYTDIGEWIDSKGKRHKEADSPRYKALGNSIALPSWKWVLKRISAQYERDATLGSLFDGIGGFPLIWEQINGKGSALWASEIEEFPIAVTKRHFPETG